MTQDIHVQSGKEGGGGVGGQRLVVFVIRQLCGIIPLLWHKSFPPFREK